jgi:hypothetical protein
MWHCSQQHENRDEAKFCGKCGEKRDTKARCPECRTVLEAEDVFCTSCGHAREAGVVAAAVVAAAVAPVAVAPIVVVAVPEPSTAPVAEVPKAEEPEPVTFSFGGAKIAMKDPSKPEVAKPAARRSGMNPLVTTILSFVLIGGVLLLALYFVTR